jgi:UDP-N-acetylglucosamine:LPS N-acetylglucosamine transferase
MDVSVKKVLFVSSTGGHLYELLELKEIFDKYDYHIITEKTDMTEHLRNEFKERINFLLFGSRAHLFTYFFKFTYNFVYSFYLYFKIRPEYIITTGTHTSVPICFIGKLFMSKIVYIESRANYVTRTLSGRIIYPIADLFIVQHENLSRLYPRAVFCLYS